MQTAGVQTETERDQQHIGMIICGEMQLISYSSGKLKKDEGGLSSFSLLDSFLPSAVEVSGGQ